MAHYNEIRNIAIIDAKSKPGNFPCVHLKRWQFRTHKITLASIEIIPDPNW
jgi:hypothetical protein